MRGFSAGLTARSTRRPSSVVSSRIIAETPSNPGRAPGRKSTRKSKSLSGRMSPLAAEPNRDNSVTWCWRQISAIAAPGNSMPTAMVSASPPLSATRSPTLHHGDPPPRQALYGRRSEWARAHTPGRQCKLDTSCVLARRTQEVFAEMPHVVQDLRQAWRMFRKSPVSRPSPL
jgi:hypothetical protein